MKVVFTLLAISELRGAAAFYELETPGLGRRYDEERKKAILRITVYPDTDGYYDARERILSLKQTCRTRSLPVFPLLVDAIKCFFKEQKPDLAWLF